MESVLVRKTSTKTSGTIKLEGSKSISNRALIIRALSRQDFNIENLSIGDDTNILQRLLSQSANEEFNTGHAGTCYRFITAYLALQEGDQILTGSARMKERPIGPLVDALKELGAKIDYLENEGYPPLRIGTLHKEAYNRDVKISGSVSSQYLSALLMIAPVLPQGICLHIQDKLVSRPYLIMTLKIMENFGISHEWLDDMTIDIQQQDYHAKDFIVESDWSAASYHYEIAAFSEEADIKLEGLFEKSLQGDRAIAEIARSYGVNSSFENGQVILTKDSSSKTDLFEYNFLKQPDLAQSVAVMAAGLGTYSIFSGLETLKIKETDRIAALQAELQKLQVYLSKLPAKFSPKSNEEFYAVNGKAESNKIQSIETYKDHRMAMAFAPLGCLFPIRIFKPMVVTKSYSKYWEDLRSLGFELEFNV